MQPSQGTAAPLEDRLRGLILSNADQGGTQGGHVTNPHSGNAIQQQPMQNKHVKSVPAADLSSSADQPQGRPRAAKKRPNQAQRRQMNAELSIPVDPRVPVEQTPKSYTGRQPKAHQQQGKRFYPHHHSSRSQPGSSRNGFQYQPPTNSGEPLSAQSYHSSSLRQGPNTLSHDQPDWRAQQPGYHEPPGGVDVLSAESFASRGRRGTHPSLYNPGGYRQYTVEPEELANQCHLLDRLCHLVVTGAEIELSEIAEKEDFRMRVEEICRSVITRHEMGHNGNTAFPLESVQLKCFGSLSSGFATKAADMDLALLSPLSGVSPDSPDSPIPRLVEKALLESGFGARLLTRTRVPIIKLCERPDDKLRLSLLEERAKWEQGLSTDGHEADDELLDDPNSPRETAAFHEVDKRELVPGEQRSELEIQAASEAGQTYQEKLSSLRQSWNQSLSSYYGKAKRLLRQLNGRDITQSNSGGFKTADFELLDVVSRAFIEGLYDESLRLRIQAYPSFYAGLSSPHINFRSLAGVMKMAEGEQLIMLWETRTLTEGDPQRDEISQGVVNRWKTLQATKMFGPHPLSFTKDLHHAVESLRSLPSIQLMQLRQEQHESATEYHARVVRIMHGLRGPNVPNPVMTSKVVEYYIRGLYDEQIREEVRDFALTSGAQSLKTIARKHKALQLALEYEKALARNLYSEEDSVLIQDYVSLLRRGLVPIAVQDSEPFDYVVPVTQTKTNIVQRIRQLPDPSRLAPNQPRDRYQDKLEFPKSGVGVLCDINFSAHLALHNTLLLRCYSYTDPRVRPLILFVKYWARARGINDAYRGTLSSYGYVLMVLHYLVNVAEPFVCPNLQQLAPPDPNLPPEALEGLTTCKGRNVRFWRDEQEIQRLVREGCLNQNKESVGALLRGFFEYYAQNNMMSTIQKRGFDWGRDVISLRTPGGLLSKQEKGWTGAKTVIQPQLGGPDNSADATGNLAPPTPAEQQPTSPEATTTPTTEQSSAKPRETKEVRLRYLFAIEDPFELDHNVARTVTHNGIVAIRDEFRRAWRIIKSAGKSGQPVEDLLEDAKQHSEQLERKQFADLLDEIHGHVVFADGV
ncbi:hypothetical protein DL768_002856 [Monosporascus sp. mg162]|nr:hypothetical protein DL768_002856 [Monosporascus sp. mg162]